MEILSAKKQLCPCCMEEHDVKAVRVQEENFFKNKKVTYTADYMYCDFADEFYATEEQMQKNDICLKDAYRIEQGLLTSGEIRQIRKQYGISQSDLCLLLGWGGKTITRYEGHQVQDRAHDTILKKLREDPEWFMHLLQEEKAGIAPASFQAYWNQAVVTFESMQSNYLRKAIQSMYARFYQEKIYNGNTELSLDKVVDVICYFANSGQEKGLGRDKLMWLLWYADFLSYKLRGKAITGLVYQAMPSGPVPVAYDSIIDLPGIAYETAEYGEKSRPEFTAVPDNHYDNLSKDERRILDGVINRFGKVSGTEMKSIQQKEQFYKKIPPKEMISFQFAKELSL